MKLNLQFPPEMPGAGAAALRLSATNRWVGVNKTGVLVIGYCILNFLFVITPKGPFFCAGRLPNLISWFCLKQGDHIPHKLTPEVKPEEQVDGCQLWVLKKYLVDRGVGQEPSELFGNGQFSLNFKALNCIPDVLNDVHFVSLNVLF